jgi:hypothetical protein
MGPVEGRTTSTTNARDSEPFLGREAELSSLATALEAAKQGHAQIVAIEGEAGMGKTALVRQFVGRYPDLVLLEASGDEAEAAVDHGLIDQLARSVPREQLVDVPLFSSGRRVKEDSFVVGAELVQALGILQERASVTVVVDDFHWADSGSARALLFALRRLRVDQVLVILALRPDGFGRLGEGWQRLLSDRSRCRRLPLRGLSGPDVRGLAARVGQKQLSSAAAERLRAHTDGHPLYLRSLLEELPDNALNATSGSLPAPHSLSETVVARVAALSSAAQDLVAVAAVVGERSSFPIVAAVAGISDATSVLEEVLAAGLLEQIPSVTVDELTFPHPLVRAAVHGDLSPTRRRDLHAAAAGLIPGTLGLSHRVAAVEGTDEHLAADLEKTAGAEILGGALSAAADHLLWASEVSSDSTTREERLLGAVFAVVLTGDEARARTMKAAVEACGEGPAKSYTLGWLAYMAGDMAEADALFRRSVESAPESSGPEAGMAAVALAILGVIRGDGPTAIVWARRALDAPPVHLAVHPYARIALALGLGMTGHPADAFSALGPIDRQSRETAPFEAELLATRGQSGSGQTTCSAPSKIFPRLSAGPAQARRYAGSPTPTATWPTLSTASAPGTTPWCTPSWACPSRRTWKGRWARWRCGSCPPLTPWPAISTRDGGRGTWPPSTSLRLGGQPSGSPRRPPGSTPPWPKRRWLGPAETMRQLSPLWRPFNEGRCGHSSTAWGRFPRVFSRPRP